MFSHKIPPLRFTPLACSLSHSTKLLICEASPLPPTTPLRVSVSVSVYVCTTRVLDQILHEAHLQRPKVHRLRSTAGVSYSRLFSLVSPIKCEPPSPYSIPHRSYANWSEIFRSRLRLWQAPACLSVAVDLVPELHLRSS